MHSANWDDRHIDDFAKFLAVEVGVLDFVTVADSASAPTPSDTRGSSHQTEQTKKQDLTEAQKYALELAKDKKAKHTLAEVVKRRIEDDKVERKIRQERERQAREAARKAKESGAGASSASKATSKARLEHISDEEDYDDSEYSDEDDEKRLDGDGSKFTSGDLAPVQLFDSLHFIPLPCWGWGWDAA